MSHSIGREKDFLGNDSVVLEVRYPGGKQEAIRKD
jgi:hypothetical protein